MLDGEGLVEDERGGFGGGVERAGWGWDEGGEGGDEEDGRCFGGALEKGYL